MNLTAIHNCNFGGDVHFGKLSRLEDLPDGPVAYPELFTSPLKKCILLFVFKRQV